MSRIQSPTASSHLLPKLLTAFPAAFVLFAMGIGLLTGCGSSVPASPAAPTSLSYASPTITATAGQTNINDLATVTGTVTSYAISPTLPVGLTFSTTTGSISGIPTTVAAQSAFTVTASNSAGSTTATVQITVNPVPPVGLVYPTTRIAATAGVAIASDVPTLTGTATSFSATPSLPAGLTFDAASGTIAGTPTAAFPQTSYLVTASNAGGSTTATVQITVTLTAPTSLSYTPNSVSGVITQSIASLTPVYTGIVTSFSVTPALPSGLSLNSTTGVVSGTPLAPLTRTSFTITAANAAGSVSTTLPVTVSASTSADLTYAQTINVSMSGEEITPILPYVAGSGSFTVSPALPSGLVLDATTGAVHGTALAPSPLTSYVVTWVGTSETAKAAFLLTVTPSYNTLLDLGHVNPIVSLHFANGNLFSEDAVGHWVLWNQSSTAMLKRGEAPRGALPCFIGGADCTSYKVWPADMAGSTLAIGLTNGLELRSSADGHLLSIITSPAVDVLARLTTSWWKLAPDGSYISAGYSGGLFVWSPTGTLLFSKTGDYSTAQASLSTSQIQIALGPAGGNVIETIALPSGTSSVGAAFQGTFKGWFLDGARYLTAQGNAVWVYSSTSVQKSLVTLPTTGGLGGEGNWIWTSNPYTVGTTPPTTNNVTLYPVGSGTAAASYTGFLVAGVPSSLTLALASTDGMTIVDLSGTTPASTTYPGPFALSSITNKNVDSNVGFAANSPTQWVAGFTDDRILDGSSLSGTTRYYGQGDIKSIAGSAGRTALALAQGKILYFDPTSTTAQGTINLVSNKLLLSSDGTTLAAGDLGPDCTTPSNMQLDVISLPTQTVVNSWTYGTSCTDAFLAGFFLSGSGTKIGRSVYGGHSTKSRQVSAVAGGAALWADTVNYDFAAPLTDLEPTTLSPDGTRLAVSTQAPPNSTTTNTTAYLYNNGTLVQAVPGWTLGWVDNNQILVNNYTPVGSNSFLAYSNVTIYNASGVAGSTVPLPQLTSFQPVSSTSIYSQDLNTIFALPSGATSWTTSLPYGGLGAVAGPYVVFLSGSRVLVVAY